ARDLQLRKQFGISLLAINRDKEVLTDNVRKLPIRSGDMLVLHSIWTALSDAATGRDLVVVTDYPKGEQRPHKFRIAMVIYAITIMIGQYTRIPSPTALTTADAALLPT